MHDKAETADVTPDEMPPAGRLTQMLLSAFVTQGTALAAKLGIADLLADGPKTTSELAAATQSHERSLYRLLRALASVGIFSETKSRTFELTPLAELLVSDRADSMRDIAIFMGEEWHWRVWGNMDYSVRTGKTAWGHVHGAEVFDYFQQNPEQSEIFNRAMTSFSLHAIQGVTDAYDFSGIKKLVDIAGGHGVLLAGVLKANPHLRGVLFDLQHVADGAAPLLKREGVADRVEIASGDFFKEVPAGADAYMMKFIIHDWDDKRSVMILRNIQRAMSDDGRVLIIEMVVPPGNEPHPGKIQDLEMLVSPGGVERTEEEYRDLLAQAGLALQRIVPTQSPLSVVEAVKK
jgi:hypothetical protein